MQRLFECWGLRVVFRLLVLLCLSIYCAMVIWGNGPDRMARYARADAAPAPMTSGIRVLPAPEKVVVAAPPPAEAEPVATVVPVAMEAPAPEPEPGLALAEADGAEIALGSAGETLPANVQLGWIGEKNANVRAGPNKRSALAGKIGAGGAVHVMWTEPNGWVRLRSADGTVEGFVHKSLITDVAPPTAPVTLATAD